MTCPICQRAALDSESAIAIQACDSCAREHGIIPMPPVTRPPKPCGQCGGRKFIHAVPREFGTDSVAYDQPVDLAAPMMVTAPPARAMTYVGTVARTDLKSGYGLLEMYICHACGAVEWYCNSPQRIPIHPHLMTELVDYDAGLYR